jgi:hypothetical protein
MENWPSFFQEAFVDLAVVLESILALSYEDKDRVKIALKDSVLPWFEGNSSIVVEALELKLGFISRKETWCSFPDLWSRCQIAKAKLDVLIPGLKYDNGSVAPEVHFETRRVKMGSRGLRFYGASSPVLLARGLVFSGVSVQIPRLQFQHGSAQVKMSQSTPLCCRYKEGPTRTSCLYVIRSAARQKRRSLRSSARAQDSTGASRAASSNHE